MKKVWRKKRINKENTEKISRELSGDVFLASLIDQAGINKNDLDEFLNPEISKMHDPFKLPDMNFAVDRIITAIQNKEKILIYGDYDADGFTSTAIIYRFLKSLGIEAEYVIPNRFEDGYGINEKYIKKAAKEKIDLIISVDCGITASEEMELAKKLNIDFVITDHHEPKNEIPDAIAVINPKRKDSKYLFSDLAGCGVAFKLVQAIALNLEIPEKEYMYLIELACIGTIADLMPVIGENRIIITEGIKRIQKGAKIPGVKKLASDLTNIDETSLAFYLIPKLNASGRMGENLALEVLIEDDEKILEKKISQLDELNERRKNIVFNLNMEAEKQIKEKGYKDDAIIFVGDYGWHEGVLGIVASRLVNKYQRPVIVFSLDKETNIAKGSGRSIDEVDLHSLMKKHEDMYLTFGGHSQALGISMKIENLAKVKKQVISEYIIPEQKIIKYNSALPARMVSLESIEKLEKLRPYGSNNEEPIFLIKNLIVSNIYKYPKITKINFTSSSNIKENNFSEKIKIYLEGITFKYDEKWELKEGDRVHILAKLDKNEYMGNISAQLYVLDVYNFKVNS